MDNTLKKTVAEFIEKKNPTTAEIKAAAKVLLQVHPAKYRAVYNTVMVEPNPTAFAKRIADELRKHYSYLKDDLTRDDVVAQDKQIIPEVEKFASDQEPARGKRADHDKLPEKIQAIWEENGKRYKNIKKFYATLKGMENAEPCDRYELVKQLKDAYTLYKEKMAIYDDYKIEEGNSEEHDDSNDADIAKKVNSARSYISKNKAKVAALKDDEDKAEEYQKKLAALQERVDVLIQTNSDFDKEELAAIGCVVE